MADCSCGCATTNATPPPADPCACGCSCCEQGTPSATNEVAHLTTLRDAIDKRLAEIGS